MSTIAVNAITDASDGNTATINSYTPTESNMAGRNRIINGGFDIWQRGSSFTSTGVNEYSADRFRTEGYGLSTTISRQTFTAGQTDVPYFPTYFCRVATSAAVGAGEFWSFQQRIEAPANVSSGETYTLSFWVRATSGTLSAGAFYYGIGSGNTASPALTTTWQKVSATTTTGTISTYLSVYLAHLPAGTPALSIDIANVQLEEGSVATPFERRQYGTELALCQRYYWRQFFSGSIVIYDRVYWNGAGNNALFNFPAPAGMRINAATVTCSPSTNGTSVSFGYHPHGNIIVYRATASGDNYFYSEDLAISAEL